MFKFMTGFGWAACLVALRWVCFVICVVVVWLCLLLWLLCL